MSNPSDRSIPPKVLGFENSQILDFHLKPQSSPSVLKLKSWTLNFRYRQPQLLQKESIILIFHIWSGGWEIKGLTKLKKTRSDQTDSVIFNLHLWSQIVPSVMKLETYKFGSRKLHHLQNNEFFWIFHIFSWSCEIRVLLS